MNRRLASCAVGLASILGACSSGTPESASSSAESISLRPIVYMPSIGSTLPPRLAPSGESAAVTPPSGNGIDYHGGPIMPGTVNIYFIWYGGWSGKAAPGILNDWAGSLGGSPIYRINTTYSDSSGSRVSGSAGLAGSASVGYSHGTSLADGDIWTVVNDVLSAGSLPSDTNGVYFVLTSSDVNETGGFCTSFCGWHTAQSRNGTNIKYSFVGDAARCNGSCGSGPSPNGDVSADSMASIIFHELSESVSDPLVNAWYDSTGAENGDKCAWNFGSTYKAANGARANVRLGDRDYLLQQMWLNASGGYCALSGGVSGGTVVFQGGDNNPASPAEWDVGDYKGDCGKSAAVTGLSANTSGGVPHALLCSGGLSAFTDSYVTTLTDVAAGDHRRASRLSDWDFGYYKSECGLNEYVSGVSQTPAGRVHGLRCASAAMTNGGQNGCETHLVTRDDRGNTATGDWDVGYFKGECGAGKAVVGVSADTSKGEPHAILCCSQ